MSDSEGLRPKFWIRLTCPEVAQRSRQLVRVIEPWLALALVSYLAWPPFQILELEHRCRSLQTVPIPVPYFSLGRRAQPLVSS